jgi:hypothetical protein
MKKSRFSTEQIITILQEHAAGAAPAELMRRHNVTQQTLSRSSAETLNQPCRRCGERWVIKISFDWGRCSRHVGFSANS